MESNSIPAGMQLFRWNPVSFQWIPVPFQQIPVDSSGIWPFLQECKGHREVLEFGAMVGSDMFQNTVFGEHMHNKQHCKVFRSAVDGCWNEYALLGESVNNHQDWIATGGRQKGFYEVHRDGIPWTFGDQKLLQ